MGAVHRERPAVGVDQQAIEQRRVAWIDSRVRPHETLNAKNFRPKHRRRERHGWTSVLCERR